MPVLDPEIADMVRAYELMGLPFSVPASVINRAHRKLAKRWHPDLYVAGSPDQVRAAQMMKSINEAYTLIRNAPLRFRGAEIRQPRVVKVAIHPRPAPHFDTGAEDPVPLDTENIEFWVRFLYGGVVGVVLGIAILLRFGQHIENPDIGFWIFIAVVLLCGLISGFASNELWYRISDATDFFSRRRFPFD